MNIKKFNQVLSAKIAKAKSFENHGDLETAIELWLEISDLTLKASKQSDIEFTYKHMLINKTEQIIQHIKELKSPIKKESVDEDIKIQESFTAAPEIKQDTLKKEKQINNNEKMKSSSNHSHFDNDFVQKNHNVIDKPVVNRNSGGIKEIEAPKEFRIITPHDPKYAEKMKKLSEETDLDVFKKTKDTYGREEKNLDEKRICFACGAILPPNIKVCTECGTKLD
jgi:hypothetical protein